MKYSLLKTSLLARASFLSRDGEAHISKRDLSQTLMLTSLIDAFSILVVYLLMSFSSTGEMAYMQANVELPKARTLKKLDRHSIVRITPQAYFIEDKEMSEADLVSGLVNLKQALVEEYGEKSPEIQTVTVQADKKIKYSRLSSVIQACSSAGFSDIKFAVLGE